MLDRLRRALRGTEGASSVEYGLLVVAIAAVIVAVLAVLGGAVKSQFAKTSSCFSSSGTAAGC